MVRLQRCVFCDFRAMRVIWLAKKRGLPKSVMYGMCGYIFKYILSRNHTTLSVYLLQRRMFILPSLHSTEQIIKLVSPAERWPSRTQRLHWAHQTHPKCPPRTTDNLHISMNSESIVMKTWRHTLFLPVPQLNGLCISTLIHIYEKSDDLPLQL